MEDVTEHYDILKLQKELENAKKRDSEIESKASDVKKKIEVLLAKKREVDGRNDKIDSKLDLFQIKFEKYNKKKLDLDSSNKKIEEKYNLLTQEHSFVDSERKSVLKRQKTLEDKIELLESHLKDIEYEKSVFKEKGEPAEVSVTEEKNYQLEAESITVENISNQEIVDERLVET